MRELVRDPQRLEHILESSQLLMDQSSSIELESLSEKDIRYYGIVKLLEIIGEAAYKLTQDFKERHPSTPWKRITDMRHILVHGYYHINKKDVIKTIEENIPELNKQVSEYLKEFD